MSSGIADILFGYIRHNRSEEKGERTHLSTSSTVEHSPKLSRHPILGRHSRMQGRSGGREWFADTEPLQKYLGGVAGPGSNSVWSFPRDRLSSPGASAVLGVFQLKFRPPP